MRRRRLRCAPAFTPATERLRKICALLPLTALLLGSCRASEAGDARAGQAIFLGKGGCSGCHRLHGRGGRLGPDLSNSSVVPEPALIESIREPSRRIPKDYRSAVVVTHEGRRTRGIVKNEDTFSIQLLGEDEEFHLFLKDDLRSLTYEPTSLMQPYDERALSRDELRDLLAYLRERP